MSYLTRLDHAFANSPVLPLHEHSKYVIMSDCHRGVGNANDNFLKNETLFLSALQTYYRLGYTYIELGDGDELWENKNICSIQNIHENVFCLLRHFRDSNRLYMLYGNHDFIKSYGECCKEFTYHEGLILQDSKTHKHLYLTHGHQADLLNSTFWKISRFLVRYIWKPLELFGVRDPTKAAMNYHIHEKSERHLIDWAVKNQALLVCGHTHRAMTGSRESPYFNSGCCVYPGSITVLELKNRQFLLVKWTFGVREDRNIYAARECLSEPLPLDLLLP